MTTPDDDDFVKLRARAVDAAPVPAEGAHLDAETIARIAAGDEDEGLDDAIRHVASCAVCRARLTDGAEGKRVVAQASRSRELAAPAPKRSPPSRAVVFAVAAALAIAAAFVVYRRTSTNDDERVAVTTRWFTGTMGTTSVAVPPEDRDVEVTIADEGRAAAVLLFDANGKRAAAPRWLEPVEGKKLHVVLAPRLLGAAPLTALLVVGPNDAIATVVATDPTDLDRARSLATANALHVESIILRP